jgi:hypothetical protein
MQKLKPQQSKRSHAEPIEPDDDPVPENIDEFRFELVRRISRYLGNRKGLWRTCKEPVCRRQRACFAPRISCSNAPPLPPQTERDHARTSFLIQRALRQVEAMRKGEEKGVKQ